MKIFHIMTGWYLSTGGFTGSVRITFVNKFESESVNKLSDHEPEKGE